MRIEQWPVRRYPWYLRLWFRWQQRRLGQLLLPVLAWGRVPRLLIGQTLMFSALNRADSPLEKRLRALIGTHISQLNDCAFCIDMNSQMVLERGGDPELLLQLPEWRSAVGFSAREKLALEFAESVTNNMLLDDTRSAVIRQEFGDDGLLELAAYCAFQNMSARFNHALQIPAQGLCTLPTPLQATTIESTAPMPTRNDSTKTSGES